MSVKCPLNQFVRCFREECAFFIITDEWIGCCITVYCWALVDEIHKVDQKQP